MSSTPIVLAGGDGGASILWRLAAYGGGASRMGIGKAATDDFSMLGTVTGGAARNLTWVGTAGSGIWDTDPANTAWTTGSSAAAFATNDNASFTASGTVSVAAGVAAGSVAVSNALGVLRLENNGFSGTTLTKSGAGTLVLAAANTLSGGVTVTGGTLVPAAAGAFGPLALVRRFSSLDQGLAMANDTPYGLASYVYGRDLSACRAVAERLEAGIVGVNEWRPLKAEIPFGGVKTSGIGAEGGEEGIREFLDTRVISLPRPQLP
jgi:autotransporter-associated beta strand protein